MSNLLTGRLKVPPAGPKDWAQTTPVELKDRDGWPIRVGARITVRHKGYRKSGEVVETFLDWKGREVVEFSINGAGHVARPEWCRVQYRKG